MMKSSAAEESNEYVNTFVLKRSAPIPSLNLMVEEYVHPATGAVHLHLSSKSEENVFMVALRTVPEDSTGVAHVLEHTALCGSERYPVRDPFFMMLRRSLNTFMNAFTSSDWTAYPFATQNKKDFSNLLDVYLDAVFFSRLDPLDFAQEGHRVEFENDDANQPLVFKGVVFNEMKGAMSSASSVLWDRLCFELFPQNTYHFNSGGDPAVIPDLTYQQLRNFYAEHYHPSNAIFLTFGDIAADQHQMIFESKVLHRFQPLDRRIEVNLQPGFSSPRQATHLYAIDSEESTANKTHLVIGWKLGESADLTAVLEAQLLSAVLMENSASPLMRYLETTVLGSAPSPLCGIEESMREMLFCCGIEGSDADQAEQFESEVLTCIKATADSGIPKDRVEAILRQIELSQREVTGDGMPYGLNLMLRALNAATHYGDAVAAIDLEPVIEELRKRVLSSSYIPDLIRRLLLENPHRVLLTVKPSQELTAKRKNAEIARLKSVKKSLNKDQTNDILALAKRLRERQEQKDDPNILPKISLTDIPTEIKFPKPMVVKSTPRHYRYQAGTNGVVYQQWASRLPALDQAEQQLVPLLTAIIPEVGIGELNYLDAQDRHSATVGGLSTFITSRAKRDDEQNYDSWMIISSKALSDRLKAQVELMRDTFLHARFDELPRIKDLTSQIRARRDQGITGNGHTLAITAACAGMSPLADSAHQQGGLEGIRKLRALDDALKNDSELGKLSFSLSSLHQKLAQSNERQLCTIADTKNLLDASELALKASSQLEKSSPSSTTFPEIRRQITEMWITNTQVNFCARAYPTVPSGHPDAPALAVLGTFMRNGFLHRSIREQGGAYGGGASHDGNIAAFRFFSYRDPRLLDTLHDFDSAIDWLLNTQHESIMLEEAVLSVIAGLDKPGSPAGEAKRHFNECLFDRTAEHRETFRSAIVNTTIDDLRRVTETYLIPGKASTAVITSPSGERDLQEQGLMLTRKELP